MGPVGEAGRRARLTSRRAGPGTSATRRRICTRLLPRARSSTARLSPRRGPALQVDRPKGRADAAGVLALRADAELRRRVGHEPGASRATRPRRGSSPMGWPGLARSRPWGSREPPRRLGPLGRRLVVPRGQRQGPRGAVRRARAGAARVVTWGRSSKSGPWRGAAAAGAVTDGGMQAMALRETRGLRHWGYQGVSGWSRLPERALWVRAQRPDRVDLDTGPAVAPELHRQMHTADRPGRTHHRHVWQSRGSRQPPPRVHRAQLPSPTPRATAAALRDSPRRRGAGPPAGPRRRRALRGRCRATPTGRVDGDDGGEPGADGRPGLDGAAAHG